VFKEGKIFPECAIFMLFRSFIDVDVEVNANVDLEVGRKLPFIKLRDMFVKLELSGRPVCRCKAELSSDSLSPGLSEPAVRLSRFDRSVLFGLCIWMVSSASALDALEPLLGCVDSVIWPSTPSLSFVFALSLFGSASKGLRVQLLFESGGNMW
jgi:hypothetical protein